MISSQKTIEYFCALDLVTEASLPRRARACSKPKRRMRSTPVRVKIEVSTATSSVGALMDAAAGAGIFALGVFADAEDVEGVRLQRALNAWQQPMWADVGILHEGLADRQQQPVQRDRVRHLRRPADRAEQDGIEALQRLDAVGRHHRAGLLVEGAGPGEFGAFQAQSRPCRRPSAAPTRPHR